MNEVRQLYIRAIGSSEATTELMQRLQSSSTPLKQAYYGASLTLKAKHSWNPYSKLKYLKEGVTCLNEAIAKDPISAEARFLRYSMEFYVPEFLIEVKHMDEDRTMIFSTLSAAPPEVQQVIANFFLDNTTCALAETRVLKRYVKT